MKIHATDITNVNLLNLIATRQDCRIILETQCATFQDIEFCLSIISSQVEVIFHGFSNYPTELGDLNLSALHALRRDFPGYRYGMADHSLSINEVPLVCLGLGYNYLEKHITISRNDRHFDWQVSLYPEEFTQMVQVVKLYNKTLGEEIKHPGIRELSFRDIMYKKVQGNQDLFLRSDKGKDYLQNEFESYSLHRVGVALIARLKSQRLKNKVLLPFVRNSIIEDLFTRLRTSKSVTHIKLTTSNLPEDQELITKIGIENSFVGHPLSVIDRMLSFVRNEKVGGVFRVTGDNPLTDVKLMELMVEMMQDNQLDYVRVNNVPFGVSAELFSSAYLWKLYLKMRNPLVSEYLSWFVLNDEGAKRGCINFLPDDKRVSLVNLSIDYQEDYDRVMKLLNRINKADPCEINLRHIVENLDLSDLMDTEKTIKLPEGKSIKFKDYLELMNSVHYVSKSVLYEKDLHNW